MSNGKDKTVVLNPSRRRFFGHSLALGGAATLGLGFHPLAAGQAIGGRRKTLVYVFLRGGQDGLSMVVPRQTGIYQADYNLNRDATRVDTTLQVSPGDPNFGLHPACSGLQDLMVDGNLAIIHGCGHYDEDTYTRSHFDAQEQVDLGTPGEQTSNTGWLTRYLDTATDAPPQPLFSALVSGGNPPPSVNGWPDVATVDSANGFSPNPGGTFEAAQLQLLAELYDGTGSLDDAVSTAMLAVEEIRDLDLSNYTPAGGVSYRDGNNRTLSGVHSDLELAASVIRSDLGVGVVTIDVGGWDTHNNQGVNQFGGYYNRIEDLSDALAVFYKDMVGAGYENDVAVIVQTEFGRQVKENDNQGTDHGLANPMLVLGSKSRINPGLHGDFPGFDNTTGNAFRPTRDFRDVMVAVAHGILGNPAVGGGQSDIFPGYNYLSIPGLLK
jgi:uncharacterized protein (DUF1501 family)